jgi:hypothetical protein
LLVFAAPHELRVEVAALEGDADGVLVAFVQQGLVFGGGDVAALFVVGERFDAQFAGLMLTFRVMRPPPSRCASSGAVCQVGSPVFFKGQV